MKGFNFTAYNLLLISMARGVTKIPSHQIPTSSQVDIIIPDHSILKNLLFSGT